MTARTTGNQTAPQSLGPIIDDLATREIGIDRDNFMRRLLRDLTGTLQDVVGEREARGFVAVIGARMGDYFNGLYCRALGRERLDRSELAGALVDLKRRIDGDFYVREIGEDSIELGNRRCPFGAYVEGRPTLCMMTSNVFGRMGAENLGYAKVEIEHAIADGQRECLVRVHTNPARAGAVRGVEYFRTDTGT